MGDDDRARLAVTEAAHDTTKDRERRRLAEALRANLRRRNARRRDLAGADASGGDPQRAEKPSAGESLGG